MCENNNFSLQELSSDISFIGADISCDSWLPGKIYRKPFRYHLDRFSCILLSDKLRQKSQKNRYCVFESHFEHFDVVFEMNSSKMGKRAKIKFMRIYYQVKWTRKRTHLYNITFWSTSVYVFGFDRKQIIVTKVVDQFEFGSIGKSLNMEVIVNEMEIAIRSRFLFLSHAKYELFHILGWFMWPSDCSMALRQ